MRYAKVVLCIVWLVQTLRLRFFQNFLMDLVWERIP